MNRELDEKIIKSILRIEEAANIAKHRGETLILAYSGGKDSDVLLDLAIKSEISFEAQHNHTTADAPQTVYHIREVFQRLDDQDVPNRINYPPDIKLDGKTVRASMWNLIVKKGMPPTRIARYCCEYFKERRFEGQHIMTGVRWAESNNRKGRGVHETLNKDKDKRMVYFDENDDRHKLLEICQLRNRAVSNPIIDWTDEDVWDYIKQNGITTNPLYFTHRLKRVGCIGCPLAGYAGMRRELAMFPKYRAAYKRAFDRLVESRTERGKPTDRAWKDGESILLWWTDPKYNPDQLTIFDEEEDR